MRRAGYSVILLLTFLHLYTTAPARRSKSLACGVHDLPPGEYWIKSPRCMNQFKKGYNCQFSLNASPKNMISITCSHFSSSSRWCRQNYLQIHVWKYCGHNKPKDVSRRSHLKIAAFSRGHPQSIKFLCQILVSQGTNDVLTSIPVAPTCISNVTTALTQAPRTAASVSTISSTVPNSSRTIVPQTTAAPTSTIVPTTSTLETTASSGATLGSTTVPENSAAPTSIVPATSTLKTTVSSTATPSSTAVPDTTTVKTTTPPCQPQPPAPVKCGMVNDRKTRIVGGEKAERNEFPWMAAVVVTGKSVPLCMATILNSLYVISFFDCIDVEDVSNVREILIHKHFTSIDDQQKRLKIERTATFPGIIAALAKLRTPIEFPTDNSVAPVCLPSDDSTDYGGQQGIVAGWGPIDARSKARPDVLMKLTVTVATHAECKAIFSWYSAKSLCTKHGDKKGLCFDYGASLITKAKDDTYSIIGIPFPEKYCGDSINLYNKITYFLPWIREQIADGEFCTNQ